MSTLLGKLKDLFERLQDILENALASLKKL